MKRWRDPWAPAGTRRTAVAVWWALLAGQAALAAGAASAGPGAWGGGRSDGIQSWVALGMGALLLVGSRLVPPRLKLPAGTPPEAVGVSRTIVAAALCEAVALNGGVAWLVDGGAVALVAAALGLVGLVLAYPSLDRWPRLCGTGPAPPRPNRLVR